MAKVIRLPGARPANEGEALVFRYLEDELPGTYTLIPNVEVVEKGRPAFEYDLIIIGPHAVYVVEVKRWLGGIQGDDYTWRVAGRHRRQNPWPTANNKARVLKSQIQRRDLRCSQVWVEAIVVIADDQGDLNLRGACRDRVFRYTDLPTFLTDPNALGDKSGNLRPLRGPLEKTIQEIGRGRSDSVLRFGDYVVEETLSRRDTVSEFLARNTLLRGEEKVRLRVFSYDPYLTPEVQERRQECIRREAEALQRIGPHPNLIALQTFFTDPNDPNLFVEVTDWSEAGTLRGLLAPDASLSLERKLELAQGIAAGLQAAHAANIIHRDVRPENVLIGHDEQPRLMNFDHARIALPDARTISPLQPDPDVPRAYQAPELLNPAIQLTPTSDLYSLGQILFEMLTGQTLYESPEDALQGTTTLGSPAEYVPDVPEPLNELVRQLLHTDAQRRPQCAADVIEVLHELREKPSGTVIEVAEPEPEPSPPPSVAPEPAKFNETDVIDDKYHVQKVLEAGGSGRVYQVYDPIRDRTFALKVFEATSLSMEFLKREVRTLEEIDHPHIVRFQGWGQLKQSGRFYLLTDFVEGDDLAAYTTPDRRLPVRDAVNLVVQLLSALGTIHPDVDRLQELRAKMEGGDITAEGYEEFGELKESGFLHRDIKPANLMLSANGLMLVDFNIAARASQAGHTHVGTPGYMLPEVGLMPWDVDGDLFATGIVLYQLITGHHPYPDNQPNAGTSPTDPRTYIPELHPNLSDILMRAASCDAEQRYHSAWRFHEDLLALDEVYLQAVTVEPVFSELVLEPGEVGKPNYNPYVTRFLRLYSQARRDNSGTRGLDKTALLTYVPTRLDRLLRPAVLDGRYRLVIITGNAGDGKTAFIKQLEESAGAQTVVHPTDNSGEFTYNGIRFVTNYDGSQDEGAERANDLVLTEFFAPFADALLDQASAERAVHVIAINEGRLIDFFGTTPGADADDSVASQFSQLGRLLGDFFESDHDASVLPDWLLVVDLNRRSVVAHDADASGLSIFERQLEALLKPEFWEACQQCELRERCPINFNVRTLADPASGAEVRERLRTLFEIVYLRRQLHITMRDLRSALSWILFRDLSCDDVAQLLESHTPSEDLLALLYHQALAFDGLPPEGRSDDRLVALLRQIDPAQVANPTVDRTLHFQEVDDLARLAFEARPVLAETWLEEWRLPRAWEALQDPDIARRIQARHAAARRIAYFERRNMGWQQMLPYQNLGRFRKLTQSSSPDLAALKVELVEGISLAEGARNQDLARQYVCLRAGQTDRVKIKSFRLYPREAFEVHIPEGKSGPYIEYTPDQIVFSHRTEDTASSQADLVISLDLLELLAQIREGFTPSLDDIQGFFINLVVFKNALAHLPYRHALLTRNDRQFYELHLNENAEVTLRPWLAERSTPDEANA
jgi:serine/threonine protein kinase